MPAFVSLSLASALRVASLNLCTDEYLLMLGKPAEIVGVSRLSQDPLESPLWRQARRFPGNRGAIEQVIGQRPTLLLTMGGGGKSTSAIAKRLGIRTITLPYPVTIDDVAGNMRAVAIALGDAQRTDRWLGELEALRRNRPATSKDAIWVSGGGTSLSPGSPTIEWMGLAGLKQRRLPNGRADLEMLLVKPPAALVRSDYRRGQMSQGNRWLDHPIVKRLADRTVDADGRAWTCGGPLMLGEVERLRRTVR
jgi:iron complex transport system substrate-binding protein